MTENPFEDAEIIHAYSRAQALADGVLIDITDSAQNFGFVYPVAVTAAVWAGAIDPAHHSAQTMTVTQALALAENMRHLLEAAATHARTGPQSDRRAFTHTVPATGEDLELVMRCGPDDHGEPVVTLMTPLDD